MSTLKSVVASTGISKHLLSSKEKSKLLDAKEMMDDEEFEDALEILEDLNKRHPGNMDVGELLTFAYLGAELHGHALQLIRKLLRNNKRSPLVLAAAVQVFTEVDAPCSTLKAMDELKQSFPEMQEFSEIDKELRPQLEELKATLLDDDNLPEKTPEFLERNEEIKLLGMENNIDEAIQLEQSVLEQYPRYADGLTLMGHLYWTKGDMDAARDYALKTLEVSPDDVTALVPLTQIHTILGEHQKAADYVNQILAIDSDEGFVWLKQCEALAYVGDDQGLLDLWGEIKSQEMEEEVAAGIKHLVAVSAVRLTLDGVALMLWKESVDADENRYFETAYLNLAMMEQPASRRFASWHFDLHQWLPPIVVDDIQNFAEMDEADEVAYKAQASKLIAKYPFLETSVEVFLDRGDPPSHMFAVMLAKTIASPEFLETLTSYVLGQRGSDAERGRLAIHLFCEGALEANEDDIVSLWVRGEWQDVKLIDIDIAEDEPIRISKKVRRILDQCVEAVQEDDFATEEKLLRQAIQMDPNCVFAYLALSENLDAQDEMAESVNVLHKAFDRMPNELSIRAKLAFYFTLAEQIEEAETFLEPLRHSEALTEMQLQFYLLAEIHLSLYEKNKTDSKAWFNLLQMNFPAVNGEALQEKIGAL